MGIQNPHEADRELLLTAAHISQTVCRILEDPHHKLVILLDQRIHRTESFRFFSGIKLTQHKQIKLPVASRKIKICSRHTI